jgi:FKBP-type peptidyl-prolyl cis-trans isomerase FkpA
VQPGPASFVEVEYVGKLANGTVFDASSKHGGKPVSFPLNTVVPCWQQSLMHMRAGGTAVIHCPAATAYGSAGAGGVIPPNADLTFNVHLVAVQQ